MAFVYRCLACENVKRPIATRCKKAPGKNGILCDEHLLKAKKGPISVLMHQDVSKTFGIPFHNQVCVTINMNKDKNKKPVAQSAQEERVRHTKNHLREQMQDLGIEELKAYHDELGLDAWNNMKKQYNKYAFKYNMVKLIIDTMLSKSSG